MLCRLPTVRAKLTALVVAVGRRHAGRAARAVVAPAPAARRRGGRPRDRRRARVPDGARRRSGRPDTRVAHPVGRRRDGARHPAARRRRARPSSRRCSSTCTRTSTCCSSTRTGKVLAQVGCDHPPANVSAIAELADLRDGQGVPGGRRARLRVGGARCAAGLRHRRAHCRAPGASSTACRSTPSTSRTPAPSSGWSWPSPSSTRATSTSWSARRRSSRTPPWASRSAPTRRSSTWATAPGRCSASSPGSSTGASARLRMLAALDVTDIHAIVRRNLLLRARDPRRRGHPLGVARQSRLARVMSGALAKREHGAQARRAARLRARRGRAHGRRARGARERLQHDGRRPQGARQAAHDVRQVHDGRGDGSPDVAARSPSAASRSR